MTISIRPARDGDLGFLVGAWLRSYRERSRRDRWIPDDLYYGEKGQRGVVMWCLESCPAFVAELTAPELQEPELLGFLCGAWDWLHFVFVKKHFRGRGISWDLAKAAEVSRDVLNVSHATGFLSALERHWCKRVIFNPYERHGSK